MLHLMVSTQLGNGLQLSNGIQTLTNTKVLRKFEALDIKLASALKPVLTKKLQILVNQKERALELTNGKPLRGRQILCMIIDHYRINTNDVDYKNITELNNVALRGDDILGFITKWDDVLLRFDQIKLPT